MALNSEVPLNVSTINVEEMEKKDRKWKEKRRKWKEKKRKFAQSWNMHMSRSLQYFMLKIIIFMGVLWIPQTTAQLTLSTPTDVQCYGRPVTLVCTHPVLPQKPEYISGDVDWMRNNEGIAVGGLGLSEYNSTTTTLQFTVTEDTIGHYTCFLANFVQIRADESNSVSVRPRDQLPTPMNTAIFSNSTTAVLTVSFDPRCCNTVQLNVDITTTSSSATTPVVLPVDSTDPTNTTIVITDITEGVCYTASIWSVCEDNNLLEDSGVLVVKFNDEIDPTINGTDSTGQPSSPTTTPVSVALPIAIVSILIIVLISCTVIMTVIVVWFLRWKLSYGQYRIEAGEEKLVLLQVCDALNRHNATIYLVLGKTVSLHSPQEESPHTQSDIRGEYKGRKFVANFVDAITEEDVEELIQVKRNSRSDRGFLLCRKKTISTFLKARLRQEDCEFVHVENLPWKFGSREERTFVEAFNSHFLVSESSSIDVMARGEAYSSLDFEQLLFALFPFLNPNKESKSPPESKVQTRSSRSPSPLSVQPHKRIPTYRRSTFIDGVVSVLKILHVTILSVGGRCRRPQCRGSTNCTHMGEYRPDIHCQYKEKSFVVKCKVRHLDGAVTREDVEILSQIREGVEAVLGCLVCDDLEMSEEVEEMLAQYNCSKAVVGLYSWNSFWVKNAIVALFQVLKMMNTPPVIPVKSARWPQYCSPQKEFQSPV